LVHLKAKLKMHRERKAVTFVMKGERVLVPGKEERVVSFDPDVTVKILEEYEREMLAVPLPLPRPVSIRKVQKSILRSPVLSFRNDPQIKRLFEWQSQFLTPSLPDVSTSRSFSVMKAAKELGLSSKDAAHLNIFKERTNFSGNCIWPGKLYHFLLSVL
jgi:hypothetical protein